MPPLRNAFPFRALLSSPGAFYRVLLTEAKLSGCKKKETQPLVLALLSRRLGWVLVAFLRPIFLLNQD